MLCYSGKILRAYRATIQGDWLMITRSSITLFHYDEEKEEYKREFFKEASVYYEHKSAPTQNALEDKL